jgi:hypothetical protein
MAVHVDTVVFFHTLHELLHKRSKYVASEHSDEYPGKRKKDHYWGSPLAFGEMIQWERASVGRFAAFGGNAHGGSTHTAIFAMATADAYSRVSRVCNLKTGCVRTRRRSWRREQWSGGDRNAAPQPKKLLPILCSRLTA